MRRLLELDLVRRAPAHPFHPVLVGLPLGLLGASVTFDALHLLVGGRVWAEVGFWDLVAGVVVGAIALVPGLVEWAALPSAARERQATSVQLTLAMWGLALFALAGMIRFAGGVHTVGAGAFLLSLCGLGMTVAAAWRADELLRDRYREPPPAPPFRPRSPTAA